MKATLKFKLNKEKHEFHQAINAWRYAESLREIKDYFDALVSQDAEYKVRVIHVQEMIVSIMESYSITTDKL